MKTKLKTGAAALLVLGVATLVLLHRQENQRLLVEAAGLRQQLEQASSLRTQNLRLAEQLKKATQTSQADRAELIPLRAQASRLLQVERENATLKSERQRLANQARQAQPSASLSEPPGRIAVGSLVVGAPAPDMTDLGVLELSDSGPTRFDIGAGQDCVITPTLLADGNLQMVIAIEVKTADGKTEKLGQAGVIARTGQLATISIGDKMIAFAAKLKTK